MEFDGVKFPTFWSQATAQDTDANGEVRSFSCWRWSDVSEQDASLAALEAARRILGKWIHGEPLDRYGYGTRSLREEVLERLTDSDGRLAAAVTRNAWGALVLNAARTMFIDIDFAPITAGQQLRYFLQKWFDKQAIAPEKARQQEAIERLKTFARDHADWNIRVYRTHSGLRAMVTHESFDPADSETLALLQAVGCDPLYTRLCKDQECFRARLTPKPWRCRHHPCATSWPRKNRSEEESFARWQAGYLDKQANYATCRYVESLGTGTIHADFSELVKLHDQLTRAEEPLPLA